MQAKVVIDGQEFGVVAHLHADGWIDLVCPVRAPQHWKAAESRLATVLSPKTIEWLTDWERSAGSFVRSGQVLAA